MTGLTVVLLLLVAAAGTGAGELTLDSPTGRRCEEITIPMCRGIGYNLTSMPNDLNHDSQDEAGLEVHQFWPLVEIKCSPDLKFFLCSVYAPICIEDYHKPLPACRSVCERARAGCAPLMQQYGFQWPERMACEKLPVHGDPENLCMEMNNRTDSPTKPTKKPTKCRGKKCHEKDCSCRCKPPLITVNRDNPFLYNRTSVHHVENCAFPCRSVFFSQEEQVFASLWITLWSSLCCVSTLMTVTTFLIDTERFKYPERPIVFLSACYFMVSIGYLTRVALGHDEVACDGQLLRYHASGPTPCTLVFLLVYFFGMASSIWWVILSFTWFLAAGLKWGNEAIAGYSQYFHLAAWFIPTIKSVGVLVMQAVDGDPVAGICYVGSTNADNLRLFVLGPLLVYLLLGTSFLFGGLVSLFRIRNVIKQQGGRAKTDKLEKLMIRIGIFSVLYTVPATIVIGCHLYESSLQEEWISPLVCSCREPLMRPVYTVILLKYFNALAVGITSGVWIWSGKTLGSWRRLWSRLCAPAPRPDAKQRKKPLLAASTVAASSSLLSGPHVAPFHQYPYKGPLSHV